ncbi:MAG TPA: hypothetical protein VFF83_08265 [Clostridia bacterium]|nr:hypothetical protein [Clostridia bacterium]
MAKGKNKNKGQVAYTSDEGDNINIKLPNTDSISTKRPSDTKGRGKKSR